MTRRFVRSAMILAGVVACGGRPAAEGRSRAVALPSDTLSTTVADVVASRTLAGRLVRITGRCLDVQSSVSIGPPPRSRHDWQLADGPSAVYVSGAFPEACTATGPPITIVARVVEDTIPGLGGRPGTPRRYLVRLAGS